MLQALNEHHALAACEVIDVAALRDETLIVGMATLLAATGLGVTLVPASMGNVQFGRPSDDRTFEIATDPKQKLTAALWTFAWQRLLPMSAAT